MDKLHPITGSVQSFRLEEKGKESVSEGGRKFTRITLSGQGILVSPTEQPTELSKTKEVSRDCFEEFDLQDKALPEKISATSSSCPSISDSSTISSNNTTTRSVTTLYSSITSSLTPSSSTIPAYSSMTINSSCIAKVNSDKPSTISHPTFTTLTSAQAMQKIELMENYIAIVMGEDLDEDCSKKIESILSVLDTMKIQAEFASCPKQTDTTVLEESTELLEFIQLSDKDELAGLMCTNYDSRQHSFRIHDMVTAPWNVYHMSDIDIDGTRFQPPPSRKGAGGLLINQAVQMGIAKGVEQLELLSLNNESTDFYLSKGFTILTKSKDGCLQPMVKKIVLIKTS